MTPEESARRLRFFNSPAAVSYREFWDFVHSLAKGEFLPAHWTSEYRLREQRAGREIAITAAELCFMLEKLNGPPTEFGAHGMRLR